MWIINKEKTHMVEAHDVYVVFGYSKRDAARIDEKAYEFRRNLMTIVDRTCPSDEKVKEEVFKWAMEQGIVEKMFLYVNGELFEEVEMTEEIKKQIPQTFIDVTNAKWVMGDG